MANKLDNTDRNLLNFRPDINYIEPDVQPGVIDPVTEDLPQLEDFLDKRRKVMKLAQAADILATFMQARADEKAQNMVINLDPKVDALVIQTMIRRFPGANPNRITYPQYRACKDAMREAGQNIAKKANITPIQINAVREEAVNALGGGTVRQPLTLQKVGSDQAALDGIPVDPVTGAPLPANAGLDNPPPGIDPNLVPAGAAEGLGSSLTVGNFDTEKARRGGLRPELDINMQIIEPLNLGEVQFSLICILVNFIWKNFILKAFGFKIFKKRISDFLPQRLCNPGTIEAPDLIILGADLPEFFTQGLPDIADIAPDIPEIDEVEG